VLDLSDAGIGLTLFAMIMTQEGLGQFLGVVNFI
jgi:hypothetical protein